MTRTDVMASSRPRTAGAALNGKRSRGIVRRAGLASTALLLAIALAGPATASAAESGSGYTQTPKTPTTTPTTPATTPATTPTTTPTTGTSPEKTSSTPTTATEPAKTPTATTATTGTLPFTGFDLRFILGFGLVLLGAGFTLVMMQRRQRRQSGR